MKPNFRKKKRILATLAAIPTPKTVTIIEFELFESYTLAMMESWIEESGYADNIKVKRQETQARMVEDELIKGFFEVFEDSALSFLEEFLCERFDVKYEKLYTDLN